MEEKEEEIEYVLQENMKKLRKIKNFPKKEKGTKNRTLCNNRQPGSSARPARPFKSN